MADKTETNNKLILTVTALTISSLIGLKFVFSSY